MPLMDLKRLGRLDRSPWRDIGRLHSTTKAGWSTSTHLQPLPGLSPSVLSDIQSIGVDGPVMSPVAVVLNPSFFETRRVERLVLRQTAGWPLQGDIGDISTALVHIHVAILAGERRDTERAVRTVGLGLSKFAVPVSAVVGIGSYLSHVLLPPE